MTDLTRARSHPAALDRLRTRIALTTEAARRAGGYISAMPHRPIAPSAEAVAALDAFRIPGRLSDGDRAALMGGTASRVYNWSPGNA